MFPQYFYIYILECNWTIFILTHDNSYQVFLSISIYIIITYIWYLISIFITFIISKFIILHSCHTYIYWINMNRSLIHQGYTFIYLYRVSQNFISSCNIRKIQNLLIKTRIGCIIFFTCLITCKQWNYRSFWEHTQS